MKEFSGFSLDVVEVATSALHAAIITLPERVSASCVNILVTHILRTAKAGERDIDVLRTRALAELHGAMQTPMIKPDD